MPSPSWARTKRASDLLTGAHGPHSWTEGEERGGGAARPPSPLPGPLGWLPSRTAMTIQVFILLPFSERRMKRKQQEEKEQGRKIQVSHFKVNESN